MRRGFAGEERWRKAGIAGEGEKSPGCEREAAERRKKEEEGFFYIRGFRRTRVRRYSVGIIKIYQMPIRENFQAVWFSRAN